MANLLQRVVFVDKDGDKRKHIISGKDQEQINNRANKMLISNPDLRQIEPKQIINE